MIYKLTYGDRAMWFCNHCSARVAYRRVTPAVVDDQLRIYNRVTVTLVRWKNATVNPPTEAVFSKDIYLDADGVHVVGDK